MVTGRMADTYDYRYDENWQLTKCTEKLQNGSITEYDKDGNRLFTKVFIKLIIELHIKRQKNQVEDGIQTRSVINGSIFKND